MRPARARLVLPLAAVLVGAVLALAGVPPAAAAAPPRYVALGDSFASGLGTRSYATDSGSCYRSLQSYPALVAARAGLALTFAACAGADTGDVRRHQLDALGPSTSYVTLTVGGNDLGFATVLSRCALPGWLGRCSAAVGRARQALADDLPGRLDRLLAAIRTRAPAARVVVTGYPRLFSGDDCSSLTFFSREEMRQLDAATDDLDATIRARTEAAGLVFVDPEPAFRDHAWCDGDAWVNGPSRPVANSYHPNTRGQAAYARLVGPALLGPGWAALPAPAPATVRLPAGVTARGGVAFAAPDLADPALVRASLAAGVTRAELARLRRAQRSGAPEATLDRLDAELTRRAAARLAAG